VLHKKKFSCPRDGFRVAAIVSSVLLTIFALGLGFSIVSSLFNLSASFPPGDFFVRSYGILALIIPLFLLYAAFILADPRWRPDRIFILSAALFPFMTLAAGFTMVRDFEIHSAGFALLDHTGKAGFSFLTVLLAVVETILIMGLCGWLFPEARGLFFRSEPHDGRIRYRRTRRRPFGSRLLLPLPGDDPAYPAGTRDRSAPRDDAVPAAEAGVEEAFPEDAPAGDASAADKPVPEIEAEGGTAGTAEAAGTAGMTGMAGTAEAAGTVTMAEVAEAAGSGDEPEIAVLPELPQADDADFPEDEFDLRDSPGEEGEETGEDYPDLEQALSKAEEYAAARGRSLAAGKGAGKAKGASSRVSPSRSYPSASYRVPVDILNQYPDGQYWIIDEATRDAAIILKETLEEFRIQAEVTGIRKGPVITMFEILPAPGVKLSKIVNLQDNIALRLAASSVRIVAPIPGKHAVGIEVPNAKRNIVSFREIIEGELNREFLHEGKRLEIPVVLGKDITGEAVTIDLAQMPHLLIAGATGSGKSVCVNAMILSILYQRTPAECRLILIDPKIVELKLYNDVPHLLTPVITEPKRAFQALQYCIYEMERRYACLDSMGVRDIRSYNRRIRERSMAAEHMPYIVVVIDEFADLMATTGKELESTVARLCAMSRAVGIHLVLATQRPSIDIITGLIKANIPSRIAFMVASKMDSRIIIDMVGAEKLLGKGDMLYAGVVDPFPIRMQGAFVSEEEVEAVVEHIKTLGKPDYIDDEIFYDEDENDPEPSLFSDGEDPLYEKAMEIVLQQGKASASYIQRRLKIGYNRAARLVETMERKGVVGPAQGSRPRELLRGL
jgi:S-DNA-T family DNA segregation ATPase FtsK/SpoIIIE